MISLSASCLIVVWSNIFIKKIRIRKLIRLINCFEDSIRMHRIMMNIFDCHITKTFYEKGELCIDNIESIANDLKIEPIIYQVKKMREEYSSLKVKVGE